MAWMARVYAHRFGGQLGPESSLAALERSLAGPVDGFEADVVLAADGEIVAIHDPLLQISTADLAGWAHEHPADVLTQAHLLDDRGDASDQRPLNLRQALRVIPKELPLQLDVKAYADPELACRTAARCCRIAAELGRASQVEVLSFFTPACEVAVEHGIRSRLVVWADYDPKRLVRWLTDRGIEGLSIEGFILGHPLRDAARDAGLTISAGAVNTAEQLRALLPLEPEILVSDTPHRIRAMLVAQQRASADRTPAEP
jgi:glycerophosphoryl diester phosphodiesterase